VRTADGTTVADVAGMGREIRPGLIVTTRCPHCGMPDVPAWPERSGVIAWFTCPSCGHDWSARLRNGRPVAEQLIEVFVPHQMRA